MPQRRPLVIRDPCFREHVGAGRHPERPERLEAIDGMLAPRLERYASLPPRPATDEEVLRVHGSEHVELLHSLAGRRAQLDADTYAGPRSAEVALLAAGAAIDAARAVARGDAPSAFALVRPPGHHAERARAMGFCLLNNVALAAEALRADCGLERIAIVDFDVHHGNGTQHVFEAERDVLFLSTHQFPLYPGTGALQEMGRDAGLGATVNLPLPAGCGDDEYVALFGALLVPLVAQFRPELILVSAGFDAHERDPLASMRVSSAGFGALTAALRTLAEDVCGGRLMLVLEGGYDLDALASSVAATLDALEVETPILPPAPTCERKFAALLQIFREAHGNHWSAVRPRILA